MRSMDEQGMHWLGPSPEVAGHRKTVVEPKECRRERSQLLQNQLREARRPAMDQH